MGALLAWWAGSLFVGLLLLELAQDAAQRGAYGSALALAGLAALGIMVGGFELSAAWRRWQEGDEDDWTDGAAA